MFFDDNAALFFVWASTHKTYLIKLQRPQNKALRIISKTGIRDSISHQYYKFKFPKIEDLVTFKIPKIMHQSIYKKITHNFDSLHIFFYTTNVSSRLTRQISNNNIFLPRFRNLRCQRSLQYVGPKTWNNIPSEIKNSSVLKFKELFEKDLIGKYKRD